MVRTPEGYWMATMQLPAGEYRFRYCADGEWFTDYAAFGIEPSRFGMDSILRVEAQPVRIMQPETTKVASEIAAA